MDAYYGVPFRVGGTGPGTRLLIGAWAELGEEPIPIDLYVCPQCGRMEQFANKKTRDRLSRAASHAPVTAMHSATSNTTVSNPGSAYYLYSL